MWRKIIFILLCCVGAFLFRHHNHFASGAERLMERPSRYLKGKKIGLVCHKPSVVRQKSHTVFLPDALKGWIRQQKDATQLVAIFSPEHGLQGTHEAFASVSGLPTSQWGCPVVSLHGQYKKPTPQMLQGIDLLLIDLQEVGVNCYTYLSTLFFVLQAAAENKVEVLLLGRPNPLRHWKAAGPVRSKAYFSFLGNVSLPFLHGKTIAQVARFMNKHIKANLSILDYRGGKKAQQEYFRSHFIKPSPNLVSFDAVKIYPITVVLEGTNYSEGRGTAEPFVQIGAPWVDGELLAKKLNATDLCGIYFIPTTFAPASIPGMDNSPKHKGRLCGGVRLQITHESCLKHVKVARLLLKTLFTLYPKESQWLRIGDKYNIDYLVGTDRWRKKITLACAA